MLSLLTPCLAVEIFGVCVFPLTVIVLYPLVNGYRERCYGTAGLCEAKFGVGGEVAGEATWDTLSVLCLSLGWLARWLLIG
jgi:hypothetical protein